MGAVMVAESARFAAPLKLTTAVEEIFAGSSPQAHDFIMLGQVTRDAMARPEERAALSQGDRPAAHWDQELTEVGPTGHLRYMKFFCTEERDAAVLGSGGCTTPDPRLTPAHALWSDFQ